jgi:tetratricopeptide (TPR) repeat protein
VRQDIGSAVALAAAALDLVSADPRAAVAAADEALRVAQAARLRAPASTAQRARGLARKELGDLDGALADLRRAVRTATAGGHEAEAAQARMSLAFALLDYGRSGRRCTRPSGPPRRCGARTRPGCGPSGR